MRAQEPSAPKSRNEAPDRTNGQGPLSYQPTVSGVDQHMSQRRLCAKHVREVYQYAQGIIEDRLLTAAASIID